VKKLRFPRRRRKARRGIFVPAGSIYDYAGTRYGRRISRSEHPDPPWWRAGGSTEGRTFTEKLRNLGVPLFDRSAGLEELGGYIRAGQSQPASQSSILPPATPTYDASAELGEYLNRGGGTP
jgi:hypothetical protein